MTLWSSDSKKPTDFAKGTTPIFAYSWYTGAVLLVHDHLINSLVVTILKQQTSVPNCPASAARTAQQNRAKFYAIPARLGGYL